MIENLENQISKICKAYENNAARLMDIVRDVQDQNSSVSKSAMKIIAEVLSIGQVDVESVVSFYAHLSEEKKGKIVVCVCNDYIDRMFGATILLKLLKKSLESLLEKQKMMALFRWSILHVLA